MAGVTEFPKCGGTTSRNTALTVWQNAEAKLYSVLEKNTLSLKRISVL